MGGHHRPMKRSRLLVAPLLASAVTVSLAAGCGEDDGSAGASTAAPTTIPQPSEAQLRAAGLGKLPVAPESERVDVAAPTFSNPTDVTNPLFPISGLHSAILSGRVDDKAFHTETTLLPQTRIIEWAPGQQVETLVSQYVAYIDGRLQEAALDFYAQSDDGSVWYFGEDVFDYRHGSVFTTEGTWLAGVDGPPAMIMPADPQVGEVARAENIPAIAFEEVTVKTVGKTVDGPTGPVEGAMVGSELHDDGAVSDKVFAPGYGEFLTRDGGDVEAMALAVPTDAADAAPRPEFEDLSIAAERAFDAIQSGNWDAAATGLGKASAAWRDLRAGEIPRRLAVEMSRALDKLAASVDARDRTRAGTAAIDVAQSTLDLELRYRPPAEIDLGRFELWARQIAVDAEAGDLGDVTGDVATMKWIRDRFAHTLEPAVLTRIDAHLLELDGTVADGDLAAASAQTERLRKTLAEIGG
jgi:hypothetical protein